MEWDSLDIQRRQFRKHWMGFDPKEVELFFDQVAEEIQRLRVENASLRRDLQEQEKDLKEHKEREKTIRNVLLNAHKTVEMMKANSEKEAKLIITDAELKAEKILQAAHQHVAQLHEDINELKRQRVQLETKLRATIEMYQQLLDMDKEDGNDSDLGSKVKVLNR